MQKIAAATAKIMHRCGADFGILGREEKDSGHEVRRFGEEMLFQSLKAHNSETDRGFRSGRHRNGRSACLECPQKRL
jgi:Fe-S oxidoreductase